MNILAYGFALFKYVIYGLSVFFTGELSINVDVLDILALRFLLSTVVLWLLKVTRVLKINVGLKDLLGKNHSPFARDLLFASLFEPVLYMFFETLGISMTTGITAAVILSLNPIASCIAESLFLKEKSTLLQKLFLALGIIGVVYIAWNTQSAGGKDSISGILFVVAAVVTGALYMTFSRKSSRAFSAMDITYISACLGMIAFNAVNIVRHIISGNLLSYFAPFLSADNMVGFLFLSVVSTIIATGMNNFALSKIQVSTMAAFSGVSTVVTIVVSVLLGSEQLYPFHLIGMALILARMIGVSAIQIRNDRRKSH